MDSRRGASRDGFEALVAFQAGVDGCAGDGLYLRQRPGSAAATKQVGDESPDRQPRSAREHGRAGLLSGESGPERNAARHMGRRTRLRRHCRHRSLRASAAGQVRQGVVPISTSTSPVIPPKNSRGVELSEETRG